MTACKMESNRDMLDKDEEFGAMRTILRLVKKSSLELYEREFQIWTAYD